MPRMAEERLKHLKKANCIMRNTCIGAEYGRAVIPILDVYQEFTDEIEACWAERDAVREALVRFYGALLFYKGKRYWLDYLTDEEQQAFQAVYDAAGIGDRADYEAFAEKVTKETE